MVTIEALHTELCALVKSVPAFADNGFSIFSDIDLPAMSALQTLPLAGVMYDGALPMDRTRNASTPVSQGSQAHSLVTRQFTVIVAVSYQFTGQDDTKPQATALLEQVCATVMGYTGVNTRPWRFIMERPETTESGDGLVFYSQVWQTDVVVKGISTHS